MFKIAWRGVRHNTGRYIATLLAIMTGVAFFAATGFLSDRIVESLEGDTVRQYGSVDVALVLEDADEGSIQFQNELRLPAAVGQQAANLPGVDAAAFVLTGSMAIDDGDGEPTAATGRLWIADEVLNPLEIDSGRGPQVGGEVAIDIGIADDLQIAVGDTIDLLSLAGAEQAAVVGITRFGDSDTIDPEGTISVAEEVAFALLSDGNEEYQEVYLRGSASQSDLQERAAEIMPAGFRAQAGDEFVQDKIDELGSFTSLITRGLQGFAILALVVGAFVIYNTFTVIVAQRVKELAVLRAIGATPKQVRRALRFEGLVVGLLGSALGVLAGFGFMFVLDFIMETLFDVRLPGSGVVVSGSTVLQAILLGTIVTVVSVMIPARRAASTEPIEALRDAAVESSVFTRRRLAFTGALVGFGLVAVLVGSNSVLLALGFVALFVATIAAGPIFAVVGARVSRPIMSRLGLEGRLASDNSARNPQRTATTANALLIGVFLVTLVSVAGASMKDFAVEQLQQIESADYLVASNGGTLDGELIENIRAVDGVEVVESFRRESVALDGVPSIISTADIATLLDITDIATFEGALDGLGDGHIAVPRPLPGEEGSKLGDTVTVSNPRGGSVDLEVVAVLEYALDLEQVGNLVSASDFDALVGDTAPTVAFVDVAAGVKADTGDALADLTANRPDLTLVDGNFFGKLIGQIFDFVINAVNGLLGMSVLVAVIGIVNTLTLSIFERRRELGLLRVVGMVDKRVQRMVQLESVLISILGTVVGVVLGLFVGWALINTIRRLEDADIAFNPAPGRIVLVLAIGMILGVLASLIPSRRSTRLDVLEAIQAT